MSRFHTVMLEQKNQLLMRPRFALAEGMHELSFKLFANRLSPRGQLGSCCRFVMGERVVKQVEDDFRAVIEPIFPFFAENCHRSHELGFPSLLDSGQSLEQLAPVARREEST